MPWVNRPSNGSSRLVMPHFAHGAGPEARIEQVQDRVLDAADILIDRHPVVVLLAVERRRLEPRRGEAVEVPARIDEGVERVGLAPRRRRRTSGRRRASRSDGGRADCPACRTRHPRAARPAGPSPAPARRRTSRNGSPGSARPSSAGATPASRAGGTAIVPLPTPISSSAGDHPGLGVLDGEAVQEIGVDDHAILDERRRRRR